MEWKEKSYGFKVPLDDYKLSNLIMELENTFKLNLKWSICLYLHMHRLCSNIEIIQSAQDLIKGMSVNVTNV